jgi:hypothetical protein
MRELILDQLETYRDEDNFSSGMMRWDDFYWSPYGITRMSRKQSKRTGFIHLDKTTRDHFEQMEDDSLLTLLTMIIRQKSKQM